MRIYEMKYEYLFYLPHHPARAGPTPGVDPVRAASGHSVDRNEGYVAPDFLG